MSSTFSLVQWEEILRSLLAMKEEKVREYSRWIAASLTGMVVLVALWLDKATLLDLGSEFWVVFSALWAFAYILCRVLWEALRRPVTNIVRVLVSGHRSEDKPDLDREVSVSDLAGSHLAVSLLVTGLLTMAGLLSPGRPLAVALISTGLWRLVCILGVVGFMLGTEAAPQPPPPTERLKRLRERSVRSGFAWASGGVAGYYTIQLWVLWGPISILFTPSLGALLLWVFAVGTILLALGTAQLLWPMVQHFSQQVHELEVLHKEVLTGALSDTGLVSDRVKDILHPFAG